MLIKDSRHRNSQEIDSKRGMSYVNIRVFNREQSNIYPFARETKKRSSNIISVQPVLFSGLKHTGALQMDLFTSFYFPHLFILFTTLATLPQFCLSLPKPCENTPASRGCWGKYSIDTDYTHVVPESGAKKEVQQHQLYCQEFSMLMISVSVLGICAEHNPSP